MEGIKIVIFILVAVIWLGIWIVKMFRNAFNQPAATNKKPFVPKPQTSVDEMIRQHRPKTEAEILERLGPRTARTLEVPEGSKKSLEVKEGSHRTLETLKPMGRSQETILGEFVAQREDIIRQRREKIIYQASDKKPVSVYAKMLQNPQTAREAIVLAEILKPKF
ncbi:hypothetical protein [Adhaeribacter terreus]|uniref:Uncharacterized protein n=1 Tax=Adhaeribacter terreus TaxID=529703 RepID=A0ABW0EAK5_9BACT